MGRNFRQYSLMGTALRHFIYFLSIHERNRYLLFFCNIEYVLDIGALAAFCNIYLVYCTARSKSFLNRMPPLDISFLFTHKAPLHTKFSYFSLTSSIIPQLIEPSGQGPFMQDGPDFSKMVGATRLTHFSISSATECISHCALLQHLCSKK